MRTPMLLKIAAASLTVAACVTINVYFPAAAAEKAADQIIDAVTSKGTTTPANAPTTPANAPAAPVGAASPAGAGPAGSAPPSSTAPPPPAASPLARQQPGSRTVLMAAAGHLLELLIPEAQAQEANLDVSTPQIRAVTASMQQRFGQLSKYFNDGAVGLTADGMVQLRNPSSVPLAERATVARLVADDNRDRATLYAEIAKANGHPEWEPQIRSTFARRWIERGARPGWYYQNAGGAWVQK